MCAKLRIPVLYEDSQLLLVNKPSGVLSLPDGYDPRSPVLAAVLRPTYGDLWVVHRLDRETSGVIALARNEQAHQKLNDQFETRQVVKVYHALVSGSPPWDEHSISAPLVIDADRHHRTLIDQQTGKPSETNFKVLERFARGKQHYTLIEAQPLTGRTHQIRVHLAALGIPVAVDVLYGSAKPVLLSELKRDYRGNVEEERPLLGRLGLHACQLTLRHPTTDQILTFDAPYPKDLAATLNQLRKVVYV